MLVERPIMEPMFLSPNYDRCACNKFEGFFKFVRLIINLALWRDPRGTLFDESIWYHILSNEIVKLHYVTNEFGPDVTWVIKSTYCVTI